jgi:hypothetical protein
MRHLADDVRTVRSPGFIFSGRFYPFGTLATVRRALNNRHKRGAPLPGNFQHTLFIAEHGADYDRAN